MTAWWIKMYHWYFFLSQVKVYNLDENKHGPDDVLVMGTDGLWDVTTDREVADAVSAYLSCCDPSDPMRYAACQIILYNRFLLSLYLLSCAVWTCSGNLHVSCSSINPVKIIISGVLLYSVRPVSGDKYFALLLCSPYIYIYICWLQLGNTLH